MKTITVDALSEELLKIHAELDKVQGDLENLTGEFVEAENAYRMAKAIAFLVAEGTVDAKKARVDIATEAERIRSHTAEGFKNAALERLRSLRAKLDATKALAYLAKAEVHSLEGPQPDWSKARAALTEPSELTEFIDDQPPVDPDGPIPF